jgi:hypothetical protein
MHNGILITTIRFSKALKSYVGTLVLLQGDGLLILPLSVLFHTGGVDITGYSLHFFINFNAYNNSPAGPYSIFRRRRKRIL